MIKFSVTKQRKLWWLLSIAIILIGIISMAISWTNPEIRSPLRLGLDFTGGTKLQYQLDCSVANNCKPIEIGSIREILKEQGLADAGIQVEGKDQTAFSIRTKDLKVDTRTKLEADINTKIGKLDPAKTQNDTVGPTLGEELFQNGLIAIGVSFGLIVIYLAFRFQWDYAFFAFVALFHDVLITMGFFSILGLVNGVEIDSLFVVGVLTIIGFSVNDTVVIYDRIREVISLNPDRPIAEIVDESVTQTLSRSINTTFTVLLTLFSIFLFGGDTLKNFALCLIVGFTAGAYSSIFIATTLFGWWRERHPAKPNSTVLGTDQGNSIATKN